MNTQTKTKNITAEWLSNEDMIVGENTEKNNAQVKKMNEDGKCPTHNCVLITQQEAMSITNALQ